MKTVSLFCGWVFFLLLIFFGEFFFRLPGNYKKKKKGKHVDYIADQIVSKVLAHIAKTHKNLRIYAPQVKRQMHLFVKARMPNPTFDAQTKETLHSRPDEIMAPVKNKNTNPFFPFTTCITTQTHPQVKFTHPFVYHKKKNHN